MLSSFFQISNNKHGNNNADYRVIDTHCSISTTLYWSLNELTPTTTIQILLFVSASLSLGESRRKITYIYSLGIFIWYFELFVPDLDTKIDL